MWIGTATGWIGTVMDLDPQLLDVLACPACHSPLRPEDTEDTEGADAAGELACTGCGLRYPVRDGIPILLVDEARNPDPQ